jgi:hypothetical protein
MLTSVPVLASVYYHCTSIRSELGLMNRRSVVLYFLCNFTSITNRATGEYRACHLSCLSVTYWTSLSPIFIDCSHQRHTRMISSQ